MAAKKKTPQGYVYSCTLCGAEYLHDQAYLHSIVECQKKERTQKGRKSWDIIRHATN